MAHIGDKIRLGLEAKGMSQEGLAEAVGVEPASVSRWIKGEFRPSKKKMPLIAKALDKTVEWLQDETDAKALSDRIAELEEKLNSTARGSGKGELLGEGVGILSAMNQDELSQAISVLKDLAARNARLRSTRGAV